jgi:hypothetical protein
MEMATVTHEWVWQVVYPSNGREWLTDDDDISNGLWLCEGRRLVIALGQHCLESVPPHFPVPPSLSLSTRSWAYLSSPPPCASQTTRPPATTPRRPSRRAPRRPCSHPSRIRSSAAPCSVYPEEERGVLGRADETLGQPPNPTSVLARRVENSRLSSDNERYPKALPAQYWYISIIRVSASRLTRSWSL